MCHNFRLKFLSFCLLYNNHYRFYYKEYNCHN
nr:MAG TPA: hypothetical protein [Caudoviricetes sp.]